MKNCIRNKGKKVLQETGVLILANLIKLRFKEGIF